MFKKVLGGMLLIAMLSVLFPSHLQASEIFDLTNAHRGIFSIDHPLEDKRIKVMVQKGTSTYYHDLNQFFHYYPLQLGSGEYTLTLLEHVSGTKYSVVYSQKVKVQLLSDEISFTQNSYPLYWKEDGNLQNLARDLTIKENSDEARARAIYEYIVKNISYDREKIHGLESDYVPSAEEILTSRKAICYDFAALYATMLRSIGIPAKVVKGYKDDIQEYHAWNEVYLKDKGWVTVDTTYDAVMLEAGKAFEFAKAADDYIVEREY